MGVHCRLQELHVADAGNLDRILEGEEQSPVGTLLGGQSGDVRAIHGDRTTGHVVAGPSGEDVGERALARAVRSHDGVHLAGVDGEAQTVENRLVVDIDSKLVDP